MSEMTMPPSTITSPTQSLLPYSGRIKTHFANKIFHMNVVGSSSDTNQSVQTHEEHFFSGLTFLAEVCSNSNIRWDDAQKHHYIEDCLPAEVELSNSHQRLFDLEGHTYEDSIPSSPTFHSMSSPNGTYIDVFSSPPRSSTIASSSPIKSIDEFDSKFYDKPLLISRPTPIHETSGPSIVKLSDNDLQTISASPLRAPNFISLSLDMSSSPLSSLLSSPSDATFDNSSSFHQDIYSSPPSSPCPHLSTFDQSPDVECSSNHVQTNDPPGRKPALKKRHPEKASSPTLRPVVFSSGKSGLDNLKARPNKAKIKSVFERKQRRSKKHYSINAKTGQMLNTAEDKENSLVRPNTSEKPFSDSNLDGLPMTGFIIETLALSRASAMTASELLRAVLRTQPQLKQELPEDKWFVIVKEILSGVEIFGRIERKGLDAADCPLEDQWFYIPENDKEPGRAEILKGLMPIKRAVTKQSKQYYFKPVSKLTRWDSEYD